MTRYSSIIFSCLFFLFALSTSDNAYANFQDAENKQEQDVSQDNANEEKDNLESKKDEAVTESSPQKQIERSKNRNCCTNKLYRPKKE